MNEHRFASHMGNADAVMWDIEKDPVLRSTITAVALMDRSPDWDRLLRRLDLASRVIPRLRQRVIVPPLRIGPPQWVVDPDFDLAYHVRRVKVPDPADMRAVLDVAQPMAMESFDRRRPLWEFTLVEGMEGGRAALIQKIHHTITDGIGGVELALSMVDDVRDPGHDDDLPVPPHPDDAGARAVLWRSVAQRVGSVVGSARSAPGVAAGIAATAVRDPAGTVKAARDLAGSLVKTLSPVTEPASPIMRGRSLARRFDTIDISMGDLADAAHAAGGSVNDAFLAASVGGLALYHREHGVPVDRLRLTMPISFRHEGDALGGNRFAPARFAVPAGIGDPAVRVRELGAIARAWQHEPALAFTEHIAFVLDRLPLTATTALFGGMLKNIDAVVTNVPGFPEPVYLAGAEIVRQYAFAPPTGAAVNLALLSHRDQACIGVVLDTMAVPDHEVLMRSVVAGFDEVLALAGHTARLTG